MNKSKLVCVYNNRDIFLKVVKNNDNSKNRELFEYDNTLDNIPITKYYNKFIDENIESDSWFVFIHQDFGFMEDVDLIIEKLNRNYIYGAVGVKIFKGIFWGKKHDIEGVKCGFKTELKLTIGQILQGDNDFGLRKHGRLAFFQPTVDAIDCCCIIIHSSLLKKYNLRFDEHLSFHMYAEELCYRTKKDYKIKTKVIQTKCFHLGKGCLDEDYQKSAQYLKEKFKIKRIPSTCPN